MINGVFQRTVDALKRLPGIGPKTAQRLGFYLLKMPEAEVVSIAQAIVDLKAKIRFCPVCQNMTEHALCEICADPTRDRSRIVVVEEPSTLYAIERTGEYRGLYHVLLGAISPLDGVTPDDIKSKELLDRLGGDQVQEVIMATDPNIEGEATALYLTRLIKPLGVKVTRLAYGIPVGIDLEYADDVTLIKSLEGRREL
ncbi:MAG: recombination protein RecR [Nitrospirae bacterium]|nr:recombination protein RecR [Nitrospirota bacterium]